MKKFLSLIAVVLVLATCLTFSVSAAEKITITSAASDMKAAKPQATAECAVENLRANVEGGLWYMGDVSEKSDDSDAAPNERYLTLGLGKEADITSIKLQWYQGGGSATDIKAEKNRVYTYYIMASNDGENYEQIYPTNAAFASSGTGADFEEVTCSFKGAKYVRVYGMGSTGDKSASNNKFFAIRNIEVYGNPTGNAGGDAGASTSKPGNTGSGNSGSTSSPSTGDFENVVIFGTVAVLSCAAVVVIRKKIRER
ncbi:MAG: discoidin domain-containing protein [Clostridia bacterium]|nr:discoidin domain-containing protein [Clostridia bacterium]